MLREARHAGAVSGAIYSINTVGNVVGTLGTALVMIPIMGSRATSPITFAGAHRAVRRGAHSAEGARA